MRRYTLRRYRIFVTLVGGLILGWLLTNIVLAKTENPEEIKCGFGLPLEEIGAITREMIPVEKLKILKTIETVHFNIFYDTDDFPSEAVADQFATIVAAAAENSWTQQITNYGFNEPPDPINPCFSNGQNV